MVQEGTKRRTPESQGNILRAKGSAANLRNIDTQGDMPNLPLAGAAEGRPAFACYERNRPLAHRGVLRLSLSRVPDARLRMTVSNGRRHLAPGNRKPEPILLPGPQLPDIHLSLINRFSHNNAVYVYLFQIFKVFHAADATARNEFDGGEGLQQF